MVILRTAGFSTKNVYGIRSTPTISQSHKDLYSLILSQQIR